MFGSKSLFDTKNYKESKLDFLFDIAKHLSEVDDKASLIAAYKLLEIIEQSEAHTGVDKAVRGLKGVVIAALKDKNSYDIIEESKKGQARL